MNELDMHVLKFLGILQLTESPGIGKTCGKKKKYKKLRKAKLHVEDLCGIPLIG